MSLLCVNCVFYTLLKCHFVKNVLYMLNASNKSRKGEEWKLRLLFLPPFLSENFGGLFPMSQPEPGEGMEASASVSSPFFVRFFWCMGAGATPTNEPGEEMEASATVSSPFFVRIFWCMGAGATFCLWKPKFDSGNLS